MEIANAVDQNSKLCADQVSYLLTDNLWPTGIKMLDAWGKLPDGLLPGNFVNLGHYDQCVNISDTTPAGPMKGKYCLVKMLKLQATFMGYGACVPDACDYKLGMGEEVQCQTKDSYSSLDMADCWFLNFLALIGVIMLLSTLYDMYTRSHGFKPDPFYILFSVLTNGEKLFETKIAPDQISCLAGVRVLSMTWIIASHRYYVFLFVPIKNSLHGFTMLFSHESFYIQAAYLAVDTFLYIGGFVLAYQCFKNRNKLTLTVKTIPYFYMHRLLRLLPPMTVVYLIHVTIIRRLASGPMYPHIVEKMREPCVNHWWSYFFFFQNYAYSKHAEDECLPHTWYLNVDLQLYLLTPMIIIPTTNYLQNNQKLKCYCTFFVVLLLSMFIPMFILFGNDYRYQHTHTRISPYIIGLIMGLFMVENKDKTFNISKKVQCVTWTATLILMWLCIYYIQNTQVYLDDKFNNNMLITFGRPIWCLCLSWIVFSCVTGHANILNKFLSNALFVVVGRLTYSMYLLQVLVLVLSIGSLRVSPYITFWSMLHGSISDIVLTTLLSIVCVLSFESPTIALAKLLLSKREPQFSKNN